MATKSEKTYLVFLILVLIICIVLTVFISQKQRDEYIPNVVNNRIHIIHTGGTTTHDLVGKKNTNMIKDNTKDYNIEKKFLEKKLSEIIKDQDDNIGTYSLQVFTPLLDSSNISVKEWIKIGEYITSVYDDYDSFIIIHGTDTLAYTASALSFMFENLSKPIIVTGSMVSMQNERSDGPNNILTSLLYASQYKIPEVVVIFDSKIYRGCCSTKINANEISSFTSPNLPSLGSVVDSNIEINNELVLKPTERATIFKPFKSRARVVVIKLYPGINGEYIRTILGAYPVHGIVFELFGVGNGPTEQSFLKAIEDLSNKKVLMVGVSQCTNRQVNQKRYNTGAELEKRGIFGGGSMTTEAALAKIYYLICNTKNYEEAIKMIRISLRGEMN